MPLEQFFILNAKYEFKDEESLCQPLVDDNP